MSPEAEREEPELSGRQTTCARALLFADRRDEATMLRMAAAPMQRGRGLSGRRRTRAPAEGRTRGEGDRAAGVASAIQIVAKHSPIDVDGRHSLVASSIVRR